MAVGLFDVGKRRVGLAKQVDMHPHEGLIDDMQPAFGQQRMHVGDAAVGRVLNGDHAKVGLAVADGLDRGLKSAAGQRRQSPGRASTQASCP